MNALHLTKSVFYGVDAIFVTPKTVEVRCGGTSWVFDPASEDAIRIKEYAGFLSAEAAAAERRYFRQAAEYERLENAGLLDPEIQRPEPPEICVHGDVNCCHAF